MAAQFNPMASQTKKLPSYALPPMASLRSPKVSMVSTLPPRSKVTSGGSRHPSGASAAGCGAPGARSAVLAARSGHW
ncbi:hypothetical protein Godav_029996 [Gossypium davidsonii]|uniref:Uncharacterized protein n=1 Tax=Gossypium davidsonii TaxID=34287 RepID=A0A7J8TFC4_GOSDV|nr:hypothetical protein [Gossypium davidsonii]